jgi:hypothetical protein
MDGLNDNGLAAIRKGMNSAFRLSPFALFAPLCAVCCVPSALRTVALDFSLRLGSLYPMNGLNDSELAAIRVD